MSEARDQSAEELLGVVNDAARAVGSRFVTFLTVGVYIAVTIASTSDEMLVRASPVTLPLLNAPIPISGLFGFYTIAPWLIVLLHWDLLLQLSAMARKISRFRAVVGNVSEEQQVRLRQRIASFHYVQFLLDDESAFFRRLSRLIVWLGVVVFPLLLLLLIQVRFLPFHDPRFTGLHRLAVVADVLLVLFLWLRLSAGSSPPATRGVLGLGNVLQTIPAHVIGAAALIFSLGVATIPGDDQPPGRRSASGVNLADAPPPTLWASVEETWFRARNLNLQEKVLTVTGMSAEVINTLDHGDALRRDEELEKVSPLTSLQGRDLRYANLYHTVMPRLDLRARRDGGAATMQRTRLSGANMSWAQMQSILLDDADLRGANLQGARIHDGSLAGALLTDADLSDAQLQGARLTGATLQRARLAGTALQGADLSKTQLQGALLAGAHLQVANLREAHLEGADLSGALLQGADLSGAHLDGTKLKGAQLQGAIVYGADIWNANFEEANLDLVDLSSIKRPHALQGATLGRCRNQPATLSHACTRLEADLYEQNLVGYLFELACADEHVARALSRWVLQGADNIDGVLRTALATHLNQGPSAGCLGLGQLSPVAKRALQRLVKQIEGAEPPAAKAIRGPGISTEAPAPPVGVRGHARSAAPPGSAATRTNPKAAAS